MSLICVKKTDNRYNKVPFTGGSYKFDESWAKSTLFLKIDFTYYHITYLKHSCINFDKK